MMATVGSSRVARPVLTARQRAVAALLAATGFWGTSFIAASVALHSIPPISQAFLRFALALALLMALLRKRGLRPVWGREAALLGCSGVAVLFTVQNYGLSLASATDASLIMGGGVPVLTAALAWRALGERLGPRALAGLVVSLIGMALVVLVAADDISGSLAGDLLLVGSATSASVYVVAGRRVFAQQGVLPVLAGSAGWGVAMLAPLAAAEVATVGVSIPAAPEVLALMYLGACCSFGAYLLWGYSLGALTATETAIISNLEVVIGVAAAGIVLHEQLSPMQGAGAVLVVAGAWLASIEPKPAGRRAFRWRRVRRRLGGVS